MPRKLLVLAAVVAAVVALLIGDIWWLLRYREDRNLTAALDRVADDYRRIIVLMDGAESLDDALRARCVATGRILFWRKKQAIEEIARSLSGKSSAIQQLERYLSDNPALRDADKLAFLDLVDGLGADRLKSVRDNLLSIQLAYREEVTRIFSQFATRGPAGTREKWESYIADLRKRFNREQVLAEFADLVPEEPADSMRGGNPNEVFGTDFAPKTVALTFDDGPHPKYTEQVLALLRKYGIKACFFELGVNLGAMEGGTPKLSQTAEIARKVLADGHVIANHSYSHPVLSRLPEAQRIKEIDQTNALLEKVAGHKTLLFRPPYGARNQQILQQLGSEGLKNIMWNIDSLDWADPIPESIAMRVLHELNKQRKGIILFHDVHKQSVLALSPVIEELQRQEYTFLTFDKGEFVKSTPPPVVERASPEVQAAAVEGRRSLYRESWALIVGINDYQNWPKLRYAVNDATGIEEALVTRFGFRRENIRKLIDGDATRQRIMEVLGDEFTDSSKVQRDDRVFVFFAGHGATRTFEDGRQLGFIIPSDAGRGNYYSTAISMSALREASDLIAARHIYFVMDSCYSGLALTRANGAYSKDRSYLEEVSRRAARQILTAGGADQQVADDGPNGHSVFTWSLLEGLQGKADLDGNGVITASELGAYVSPIVSSFARQTPAVGNLLGSEGGEFLFELQPQSLTSQSPQLEGEALKLTEQLASLQKEIASKQGELLKLQQSIQAESAKLAVVTQSDAKPKPVRAYDFDRQGQQLYREKKYEEALQKFQAAVALKPNDPVLINNLGYIYYAMDRYDESLTWLLKTLAIDPNRKEAHLNLGDLYLKMDRKSEARQHYEQFLALYPASQRAEEIRKTLQSFR